MRLTKNEIKQIKELRELSIEQLAKQFNVSKQTIKYHLSNEFRIEKINQVKKYNKKLPKKRKREIQISKREYFKNYFKQRYRTDKEFREKHIARVIKNSKKKYQTDKNFREKQLENSRNQWKNRIERREKWV